MAKTVTPTTVNTVKAGTPRVPPMSANDTAGGMSHRQALLPPLLAGEVDQAGAAEPALRLSPTQRPAPKADVDEIAVTLDLDRESAERIADFVHAECRAETDAAATAWRQRLNELGYEVKPEIRAGLLAPSEPQQRTPTATRAYVADVAARLDVDTALAGEVADLILAWVEHNLDGLDRWWD